MTKNREDAEDVLQDSLLRAFTHLDSFEGRSSFSSWLTKIAINSALMMLRKKRRREVSIGHARDDFEAWQAWDPCDPGETPESLYALQERDALLTTAILRLPPIFRDVVELQRAHEYSANEVAEALAISVTATKSRLVRARTAVRKSFPELSLTL